MKYFLSFLLMGILLPIFSSAQSNYTPGYVITLKGDTIRGFIDYREWNVNPPIINFKGTINDINSGKYTAADISYFNISNLESYKRYISRISTDPTSPDK